MTTPRRKFLVATTALGVAGLATVSRAFAEPTKDGGAQEKKKETPEEEVSALEDLMREHGVLSRILLIYEESLRRLRAGKELAAESLHESAALVRRFVEDYHEKLEENFIFPEFAKQREFTPLVRVLARQHDAGRKLTDTVLAGTTPEQLGKAQSRSQLIAACEAFLRMYRPHKAREDTVLFPAMHGMVPEKRLDELGEHFEKEEDRLLGQHGFERVVQQVAGIEKQLGIYDLAHFTPTQG